MKNKVIWNYSAENDLNEIIDYIIEKEGINTAFKLYNEIKECAKLLAVSPEQGRVVPELKMFTTKYREIIYKPWRLIYKIDEKVIKMLLVLDSRRNIEDIPVSYLIRTYGA